MRAHVDFTTPTFILQRASTFLMTSYLIQVFVDFREVLREEARGEGMKGVRMPNTKVRGAYLTGEGRGEGRRIYKCNVCTVRDITLRSRERARAESRRVCAPLFSRDPGAPSTRRGNMKTACLPRRQHHRGRAEYSEGGINLDLILIKRPRPQFVSL